MIDILRTGCGPLKHEILRASMPRRRNDPREWTPVSLIDSGDGGRQLGRLSLPWQYIVCNPATYPPEIFAQVAIQLIHYPERNSKNIRRADILSDTDDTPELSTGFVEKFDGMVCTRNIRRRLMPRNPNLDPELEQTCRLYATDGEQWPTLVTYHCHYDEDVGIPFYVPDVLGIAFELYEDNIYLAYLPLPNKPGTDERLQRVAINLLRTIHRHWYNQLLFLLTIVLVQRKGTRNESTMMFLWINLNTRICTFLSRTATPNNSSEIGPRTLTRSNMFLKISLSLRS